MLDSPLACDRFIREEQGERWHSQPWHQETAQMSPTSKNSPTVHTKLLLQHFSGKNTALGPGHPPTASLLGQYTPNSLKETTESSDSEPLKSPPKETVLHKSVRADLLQLTMWHSRTKAGPSQCFAPGLVTLQCALLCCCPYHLVVQCYH